MIQRPFILLFIFLFSLQQAFSQTASLSVKTRISEEIRDKFIPEGRIFLFISGPNGREPRLNIWPGSSTKIYATNINKWKKGKTITLDASTGMTKSTAISLDQIPSGRYRIQVVWAQNREASRLNVGGNLYSETLHLDLNGDRTVEIPVNKVMQPQKLAAHPLLKEVDIKSTVLSEWWDREIRLKAAVLLPAGYFEQPERNYPVRYTIAGYGGRYTRANQFVEWDHDFMEWWQSDDAPQIINVFLDGEGHYGDCYQLNSENSGPYGTALTEELIPYIEEQFRGLGTPESRFLDGCSTGGWVSLTLQLFYPEFFGGCFSYSPDPVDFNNFQLINIYQDENAFYNEHGYLRPVAREISGEPTISLKDFIQVENVLGHNNTYLTSGGQFGAFTALYSPRGKDGLPVPLFDPVSGEINPSVAEHWTKYDLTDHVKTNWKTLGPKIQGKIWIWMGDMDNFYLNPALREFDAMLREMENPASDAIIHFSPMKGHCDEYNHRKVLMQIEKLRN